MEHKDKKSECCDECWNSKYSLKNKYGSCGLVCEYHLKCEACKNPLLPRNHTGRNNCDFKEVYLTQPQKEDWEREMYDRFWIKGISNWDMYNQMTLFIKNQISKAEERTTSNIIKKINELPEYVFTNVNDKIGYDNGIFIFKGDLQAITNIKEQ